MAKRSAKEKAAWILGISGIIGVIITVFGTPMYDERPIAQVSFDLDKDNSIDMLQKEGDNYFIEAEWYNTGKGDIFSVLSYTGTNVKISYNKNGPWDYETSQQFNVGAHNKVVTTKVFLTPDPDANEIKIYFNLEVHPEQNPFQKLTPIIPTMLTYEKSGNDYILSDAR